MNILYKLLIWLGQTFVILFIFYFVLPSLINAYTRNSWIKLPIMLFFAILAGIFMAWLKYVPGLLLPVWIAMTYHTLKSMQEKIFIHESNLLINKPLFYFSSYSYIIVACLTAYFLQTDVVTIANPMAKGIPLWQHILKLN